MPSPFEKQGRYIPALPGLDRRVKLTPEQRETIRKNDLGLSNAALAREYKVSKRLIQFIRNPDAHRENVQRRRERGADYYDRDAHRESMRRHRAHKADLYRKGLLEP